MLIALTETISVWSEGTQQNHYVFLLRTLLTPVKLSAGALPPTVGEASDAACGTPPAGPRGHVPPEKVQVEASPQSKRVSLHHIKEH